MTSYSNLMLGKRMLNGSQQNRLHQNQMQLQKRIKVENN